MGPYTHQPADPLKFQTQQAAASRPIPPTDFQTQQTAGQAASEPTACPKGYIPMLDNFW